MCLRTPSWPTLTVAAASPHKSWGSPAESWPSVHPPLTEASLRWKSTRPGGSDMKRIHTLFIALMLGAAAAAGLLAATRTVDLGRATSPRPASAQAIAAAPQSSTEPSMRSKLHSRSGLPSCQRFRMHGTPAWPASTTRRRRAGSYTFARRPQSTRRRRRTRTTTPSTKRTRARMTSHVARLYALAGAILVFLVTWAAAAAHPWQPAQRATATDPRVAALVLREQRLRSESAHVQQIVDRRWAHYRQALAKRKKEIAAAKQQQQAWLAAAASSSASVAPSVRVVTLPPVTTTKTS